MAHFSTSKKEQAECIDQIYAVIKRYKGVPAPRGKLTLETGKDLNCVIGAIEFLLEKGDIVLVREGSGESEEGFTLVK